jgi:hypothetical protein
MLTRLDQKVGGRVRRLRTPPAQSQVPPATSRDLTHTVTAAERGKPVIFRLPQGRKATREGRS